MSRIVKPESLHLQAYNIIKKGILEGDYQPSERVVEARMADKLGISRGPVREALRMLIQDGLLNYNDGFVRVYQPTVQDVVEIFQCRESLETLAISLAIKHISDEEQKQLATNLKETSQAFANDKSMELGKLDQQFHDIIITASKNKQLMELLDVIRTKIHYMRTSMVNGDFYPSFVEEHERIYQILLEGNEEEAATIMKKHINKGLEGVLMHIDTK
ncbi:GntR family transcriptional regulator [Lentibacillus sp. Marseille-P4043]|uniref:GntR family transcriptional regulator n=1 Tax=Lentibacillus sp. Marseille-P4043 TaxID=2040293 RepID=UPI000D0B2337|nr:GntR family transcriptional regulator [Lentibacillus sp. Marseille-P4043]